MLKQPLPVPQHLPVNYQRLLIESAHLLMQDQDVDALCQSVFDLIREPLHLDVYFHYLVSPDKTHLYLASSGGNEIVRQALGTDLQFGQAVCGTVAQTCEWMYVTDVQHRTDEMTALIRSFGVRCYSCQPLIMHGEIIGTLSFGSSSRDSFMPEELEIFQLIAQQVNLATDRRRQNEHIRDLEKLATAGRMCATLAHEINNPLESLVNLLYLVRDEVKSDIGAEFVRQAEAEVLRLSETTQRTLDLFRGKQQSPRLVDLSELTEELLDSLKLPVRLIRDIEPGICVFAIPGELRQIIFNIVRNASQFSPVGGEVTVTLHKSDGSAILSVKDQGPGIPRNMRSQLFQPFYTTRVEGGTGIGLWISREMIRHAGGTLTFESDPETKPGTEFLITLPIHKG